MVDFAPRTPSDLVICYDVLQYLDDRAAARAIANLARLTRAALYVSALTERGLARELRPQPHRPIRASAVRGLVPAATASALPLSGFRRLAAQGRDRNLWDMERL